MTNKTQQLQSILGPFLEINSLQALANTLENVSFEPQIGERLFVDMKNTLLKHINEISCDPITLRSFTMSNFALQVLPQPIVATILSNLEARNAVILTRTSKHFQSTCIYSPLHYTPISKHIAKPFVQDLFVVSLKS